MRLMRQRGRRHLTFRLEGAASKNDAHDTLHAALCAAARKHLKGKRGTIFVDVDEDDSTCATAAIRVDKGEQVPDAVADEVAAVLAARGAVEVPADMGDITKPRSWRPPAVDRRPPVTPPEDQ